MPNLLKNLHLEEHSLVDRPANAQAMVSLFKRDNSDKETKMNDEQEMEAPVAEVIAEKADEAPEAELIDIEALKADVARFSAENEKLRKGLIYAGFIITAEAIEKKAEVEMMDIEGEMVVKSDIPAPVLKHLKLLM